MKSKSMKHDDKKWKIYIVPHTHWDREWMFTEQAGNVLLNDFFFNLLENIKKDDDFAILLDGQSSLIDDFIKWNPLFKDKIVNFFKNSKAVFGPFFSQPDLYNSLLETTIRNLQMGQEVVQELGLKTSHTAYLPDTFGFTFNLPQVFKKNGLTSFVHWRGLTEKQSEYHNLYFWEGIDKTKIKSLNYPFGYYALGQFYPYKTVTKDNLEDEAKTFYQNLLKLIERLKTNAVDKTLLIPLGGDQAPTLKYLKKIFSLISKWDMKHQFIITSNFDDYFASLEVKDGAKNTVVGNINTPYSARIHRTISSSRYDIKKLFRECEKILYYELEPLEILFKKLGFKITWEEFKKETIFKPLFKLQAHDSLGASNTDVTNDDILAKLKQVKRYASSLIDLMMRKINFKRRLETKKNLLTLYNPYFKKREYLSLQTIYSNHKNFDIRTKEFVLQTVESEDITLDRETYKHLVLIWKNSLEPWDIKQIDLDEIISQKLQLENAISDLKFSVEEDFYCIKNEKLKKEFKFSLDIMSDEGDNYDFSPGEEIIFSQKNELLWEKNLIKAKIVKTSTTLFHNQKKSIFEITWIIKQDALEFTIKKVAWQFNCKYSLKLKHHESNLKSLFNFAEYEPKNAIIAKDWKEKCVEYPANVFHSNGLLLFNENNDVQLFSEANYEFFFEKETLLLTLAKTNDLVSNSNLNWRPKRASGLQYKEAANQNFFNEEHEFSFELSFAKNYKSFINQKNLKVQSFFWQWSHLTSNSLNKFEIDIPQEDKQFLNQEMPSLNDQEVVISSMLQKEGKIYLRIYNPSSNTIKTTFKEEEIVLKPYQYKDLQW